jgi:hypothetical protein
MQAMKTMPPKRGPTVVRVRHRRLTETLDCDLVVCGGTLGLLLALALQVCLSSNLAQSIAGSWTGPAFKQQLVFVMETQVMHAGPGMYVVHIYDWVEHTSVWLFKIVTSCLRSSKGTESELWRRGE